MRPGANARQPQRALTHDLRAGDQCGEMLVAAGLPLPFTMQVFNPYAEERFDRYKTHLAVDDIAEDVDATMSYPVVVKKTRGSVSSGVFFESDRAGVTARLQDLFENAGFEWRSAGCSMCLAMNADKLDAGERCASTSNRNFEGRISPHVRASYLASPILVIAYALFGNILGLFLQLKRITLK